MKKAKKEAVLSVQKVTKLQEELKKAEANIVSLGHVVVSFIDFEKAFDVSCEKWLVFSCSASGYKSYRLPQRCYVM